MLGVMRECGALAALLPEVDALFGVVTGERPQDAERMSGARSIAPRASKGNCRCATRCWRRTSGRRRWRRACRRRTGRERISARLASILSARLRVPVDCRDAAHLAARFHRSVHHAAELRPSRLLDLIVACDAMRRPQRLAWLAQAAEADACALPGAADDYPQARVLVAGWRS